jgi:hypothetical protein
MLEAERIFVCCFQASRSGMQKRGWEDSDEDDVPLMARKKIKTESKKRKEEIDEEDFRHVVSCKVLINRFNFL